MNKIILYISIFTFFSTSLFSQQEKIDSFLQVAQNAPNDSLLILALYEVSFIYSNINPDSGLHYAQKCYDLSVKNNFKDQEAFASSQLAYSYSVIDLIDSAVVYWAKSAEGFGELNDLYRQSDVLDNAGGLLVEVNRYDEALPFLKRAEKIAKNNDYLDLLVDTYMNYGLINDYKGNYDEAYDLYNKALIYADSSGSESRKMSVLNNIGVMFYFMEDYYKAIPYFYDVLSYWKKSKNYRSVSMAYKNLGSSYELLNKNDSALYYHHLALELDIKLNSLHNQGKDYHNIGVIYEKLNQDEEALEYFLLAEKLKIESGIGESIGNTYQYLAEIYLKSDRYALAKEYIDKHLKAALKVQSKEQLRRAYESYAIYFEKIGDYKNALINYQEFKILNDSIYELGKIEAINDIETRYKVKEKEQEAVLLKKQNEIEGTRADRNQLLVVFLLLITLVVLFVFWREYNSRKMINKLRSAEHHRTSNNYTRVLFALEEQIERTQNETVKIAINKGRSLIQTSTVLHTIINSSIYKSKDIKYILMDNYFNELCTNLKQIFFPDDECQVIVSVDNDIRLNVKVIQPLFLIVEELFTNSWKHAFTKQPSPQIKISLKKLSASHIRLTYADNGSGLPKNILFSKDDIGGLDIIRNFTNSLKGNFKAEDANGVLFHLDFQDQGFAQ